jgi:uncharacterized membrane protein
LAGSTQAAASDRKLVQFFLRSGLVISMILMMMGLVVNMSTGYNEAVPVAMFELFDESLMLGDRLLGFGVLILSLTPAIRVITLTILWTREKDWKFVGISIVVITALIISVALGGHA